MTVQLRVVYNDIHHYAVERIMKKNQKQTDFTFCSVFNVRRAFSLRKNRGEEFKRIQNNSDMFLWPKQKNLLQR